LSWPRMEIGWVDGQLFSADEIPKRIESANIEAALQDAKGEDLFPVHDGATVTAESTSVGPLSESKTYATSKKPVAVFEVVKSLLEPLLVRGSKLVRGMG